MPQISASCHSSRIAVLERKCRQMHAKILHLQKLMKSVEKRSMKNLIWRKLLDSAVKGLNEALCDLEKRVDHIEEELSEVV